MPTKNTRVKKSQTEAKTPKKPRKAKQTAPPAAVPPMKMSASIPVVGIGASAGGLEAFEQFFTHLPPDSGMAFVIVQHLDPTHESILTDLLKKFTRMSVMQVEDQTSVKANRIYVIPPNTDMELQDGTLRLVKPTMPRGLRLPIDHFFRSLATDQGEKAICIILSGTGTDGTLGMKTIKEEGGLAIVQAPESARYDGMPLSAINTGLVDMVLPPDKIAQQLMDYIKRSFVSGARRTRPFAPGISDHMQSIFFLLKNHTGYDFSGYKENTIARRIERRMAVNQIANVEDYLKHLQNSPVEIETLFRELLIGVTNFFRDRSAFEYLEEKVIAPLFSEQRNPPRQIRVWIPGCSTGEEAYSVAILLREHMEKSNRPVEIQIFATDIDQTAIIKAREGRYPDSIAADVTPERLKRYFKRENEGNAYQVKRQIRDMVVFAVQSVIKDPPFSKLDLVCCRNLMIYLGPELQQKLLSLFHYALNPSGFLFLGNSETLGNSQKLFRTIDQKWKIFQRAEFVSDIKTVLEFSGHVKRDVKSLGTLPEKQVSAREVTEQMLLAEYVPISILINERGEMLYIHGPTGKYLEQGTGEATTNILKVAREGLRMPLSTAIRNTSAQKKPQTVEAVSIKSGKETIRVQLSVAPVLKPAAMQGLMLVTLTEISAAPASDASDEDDGADYLHTQHIAELEQELKSTREYLQTIIEELETTNEELKSSNEELQSSNEELQSTNEELQTSKEELQSVNEELVTVNTELQFKVDELTLANNDVKNLMESTQVGIIFLDTQLRIRRFTHASNQIVDLLPQDIGRPLKQFVHKLHYNRLNQEAQAALKTQTVKEIEVQADDGNWYLLRIMPYRTVDDHIEGVVLTLTDITQIKQAAEELRQGAEKWRSLFEVLPVGVSIVDANNQVIESNPALSQILAMTPQGISKGEYVRRKYLRSDHAPMSSEEFPSLRAIKEQTIIRNVEMGVEKEDGEMIWTSISATPLSLTSSATVTVDITERKRMEEELRESKEKYAVLFGKASVPTVLTKMPEGVFVDINEAFHKEFGYTHAEVFGKTSLEIGMAQPDERAHTYVDLEQQHGTVRDSEKHFLTKTGEERICTIYVNKIKLQGDDYVITTIHNITERKRMEEALRESEARFVAAFIDNPVPLSITTSDGVRIDVNNSFCELTGYSQQELIGGIGGQDLFTIPKQNPRELLEIENKTGSLHNIEIALRTKSGEFRDILMSTRLISLKGEQHRITTLVDITERKRAEAELHKLSRVIEQGQVSVVITDATGAIEYVNPRFCEVTGYSRAEILGKNPSILKSGYTSEAEYKVLWETITAGREWRGEFRNVKKNGEFFWESATITPITDERGVITQFVEMNEDITERKRAEAEVQQLYTQAQEDARIKAELLDEVNHRVKNNLVRIQSILQLKGRELSLHSGEQQILEDMQTRIEGMLTVHTMLSASLWSPLEIGELCRQIIQGALRASPIQSNLALKITFHPDSLAQQLIFPGQATTLALILNELSMNSVKYAFIDRDKGSIRLDISLESEHGSNLIKLTFADDGPGWPAGVLEEGREGLGLQLIRGSLQSLPQGSLRLFNENGAAILIEFRLA